MELTTFIHGSAHDLHQLADQSVQMIATSPPYYGLRAYAGEQGVEWPEELPEPPDGGSAGLEATNGDATPQDGTAASLTDSRLVCISDGKAPRLGLESGLP